MRSKWLLLSTLALVAGISSPLSTQFQAKADETCIAFRPLSSNSYEVRKSVSSTGVTPGIRNNWDTDFIVPGGTRFTRYIATITSETPENYNVIINFRFPDKTARQVFRRDGLRLVGGVPFQIIGDPPTSSVQPFQINVNVSGRQGATYRLGVSGCSQQ
ncbi:MAG: hypothetical protein NW224_09370 [Leptolyngbyaceae cyanobacterium bins.302]|nr:hypothetical protein [Leptolyngbyaceae cyanobacterium bins.302]